MRKELAKSYDPSIVEDRLYQLWLDKKYFHAEVDKSKEPFTIVMPPPNITGQLHMGHALDNTIQDILTRYKRMDGYNALWMPGTDHASISTEVKIVEKMASEGLTKKDITREEFLERAWAWKEEYGGIILKQLRKLGRRRRILPGYHQTGLCERRRIFDHRRAVSARCVEREWRHRAWTQRGLVL